MCREIRGTVRQLALYKVYSQMKQRCYNPKCKIYKHYGGRGIQVCDRWLESFWNFVDDMGERPEGHSLDRIDNDGNYEPSNCKWSSQNEQTRNSRRNVLYEFEGEVLVEIDLARKLDISRTALSNRRKRGWNDEYLTSNKKYWSKVYLTVDGQTLCMAEWSRAKGIPKTTLCKRKRRGWSDYECIYGKGAKPNE